MKINGRESNDRKESDVCVFVAGAGWHPLKQVFDMYIEEEISDEQIQRVLEPVLKLINEGAFSKPHKMHNPAKSVMSLLAAVVMTAFAAGIS